MGKIKQSWAVFFAKTWVRLLVVAVGVPLFAAATWAASGMGIPKSAQTNAPADSGPLRFSFKDSGRPLIQVNKIRPGDTVTRCLRVTSDSTIASDVNLRWQFDGPLADYLTLSAEEGSGNVPPGGSCNQFIPSGSYVHGTNANGVGVKNLVNQSYSGWPAGVEHVYRFRFKFNDSPVASRVGSAAQNQSASAGYYLDASAADPSDTLGLLSPPVLFGSFVVGSTVGTSSGSWQGRPDNFSYQWQRCRGNSCDDIGGAAGPSYRLTSNDLGFTMRSRVTARQGGQSLAALSNFSPRAVGYGLPLSLAPPKIFGSTRVGRTLLSSSGRWLPRDVSLTYQWQRCDSGGCDSIRGANDKTYKLRAPDKGDRMRVVVRASNEFGSKQRLSRQSRLVR